ncbi:hypothetical protein TNCV_1491701 [Trichonephila clavipes]|nr:hypothetical protein TNCV_1491701 [Trichonephila clavipes]
MALCGSTRIRAKHNVVSRTACWSRQKCCCKKACGITDFPRNRKCWASTQGAGRANAPLHQLMTGIYTVNSPSDTEEQRMRIAAAKTVARCGGGDEACPASNSTQSATHEEGPTPAVCIPLTHAPCAARRSRWAAGIEIGSSMIGATSASSQTEPIQP